MSEQTRAAELAVDLLKSLIERSPTATGAISKSTGEVAGAFKTMFDAIYEEIRTKPQ